MKKRITQRMFRDLDLNATERLLLASFVPGGGKWIARNAVALETILRRVLHQQGLLLLRLQQAEPHPVYELSLRLVRSPLASKPEIERAVCLAFAVAGRSVKPKFAQAVTCGDRARVSAYVDG